MQLKFFALGFALLCPVSLTWAQQTPSTLVATAPVLATKTVFAEGFSEPQGIVVEGNGNVVLTDYEAGEIIRLDTDGKRLDVLATGLKSPSQIVIGQLRRLSETKAESGLNSGSPVMDTSGFYITERKANRVIHLGTDGKITAMGSEIAEPIGIVGGGKNLSVISHTTSKMYSWQTNVPLLSDIPIIGRLFTSRSNSLIDTRGKWSLQYSASQTEGERYGFRCLAAEGDTLFLTDETDGAVWMLSPSGKIAKFSEGLGDPSGLAFGPDRTLYVCDEGNGGRLWQLNREGKGTVVATGLGRPRGIVFTDAKTALVANRDGNVWKLTF